MSTPNLYPKVISGFITEAQHHKLEELRRVGHLSVGQALRLLIDAAEFEPMHLHVRLPRPPRDATPRRRRAS